MTSMVVQDLGFSFRRGPKLFEDLTVQVSTEGTGRIVGLLGPSGCGKTTFCRLVLGLLTPTAGTIRFTPAGARLAYVPQDPVLYSGLSLDENLTCLRDSVTLGATFSNESCSRATVALGLAEHRSEKRDVRNLSGGEAQRVMLIRLLSIGAEVAVLDEPFASLDNRTKETVQGAVRSFVSDHDAIAILVTHSWAEARLLAHEVLFFESDGDAGVRVTQRTVEEAERLPPTVGAFFTMRWPGCRLVPKERLLAAGSLSNPFADDKVIRSVGMYAVGLSGQTGELMTEDELIRELLTEVEGGVPRTIQAIGFDAKGDAIRRIWPTDKGCAK